MNPLHFFKDDQEDTKILGHKFNNGDIEAFAGVIVIISVFLFVTVSMIIHFVK